LRRAPPVCHISGFFTLTTPLPANSLTTVTPLDFAFTDGLATIDKSNATAATAFWIFTGPSGEITDWNNPYASATNIMFSGTNPAGCAGCSVTDEGGDLVPSYYARILDNPGVWTVTSTPVPEPPPLALLSGGLLVAGGLVCLRLAVTDPPAEPGGIDS
jgi:hypothetical protein